MSSSSVGKVPLASADALGTIVPEQGSYGAQEQKSPTHVSVSSIAPAPAAAPMIDAATLALAMQLVASGALSPQSREETLQLPEGTYVGEVSNGQPHGRGVLTYLQTDKYKRLRYEGQFLNGQRHGIGALIWKDGKRYDGPWENGGMNGQGIERYADGSVYEGAFVNGECQGAGIWRFPDGKTIQGIFARGYPNGRCTMTCANCDRYVGEFLDGRLHGQGEYTFADGNTYKGQFTHDKMTGRARREIRTVYGLHVVEGDFVNGTLINGRAGTKTVRNGVEQGQFCVIL